MHELQLTEGIVRLAGGLMMGSALVLLYLMLRGRQASQGNDGSIDGEKWFALLGFFLGVPLGIYVILHFVQGPTNDAPQNVLVGLIAGAGLTYLLARRPMRQ